MCIVISYKLRVASTHRALHEEPFRFQIYFPLFLQVLYAVFVEPKHVL